MTSEPTRKLPNSENISHQVHVPCMYVCIQHVFRIIGRDQVGRVVLGTEEAQPAGGNIQRGSIELGRDLGSRDYPSGNPQAPALHSST